MKYPIDLKVYRDKVDSSTDLYKLDRGIRYNNSYLIFPFNKYIHYAPEWIFSPVVDLQYFLALNNDGINITECFNQWLDEVTKRGFLENGYLIHRYYHPFYRLMPGWSSGMAQGLLLSCLLRVDTPSDGLMRAVINSLTSKPIASDTILGPYIEEYPHENNSMVLNGFLFGLIGLLEYLQNTRDSETRYIVKIKSLNYLETLIGSYLLYLSSPVNSMYDLQGRPADCHYHRLHLRQLEAVNILAKETLGISITEIYRAFKEQRIEENTKKVKFSIRKIFNLLCILRYKLEHEI